MVGGWPLMHGLPVNLWLFLEDFYHRRWGFPQLRVSSTGCCITNITNYYLFQRDFRFEESFDITISKSEGVCAWNY